VRQILAAGIAGGRFMAYTFPNDLRFP
jgi:hypothetical protein